MRLRLLFIDVSDTPQLLAPRFNAKCDPMDTVDRESCGLLSLAVPMFAAQVEIENRGLFP